MGWMHRHPYWGKGGEDLLINGVDGPKLIYLKCRNIRNAYHVADPKGGSNARKRVRTL